MKTILLINLLILISVFSYSQNPIQFNNLYNSFGNRQTDANKVHQHNGEFIIQIDYHGFDKDFALLKLDSLGNEIYKKSYYIEDVGYAYKYSKVIWKEDKFIFFTRNPDTVASLTIVAFDYNFDTLWTKHIENSLFFSDADRNLPTGVVETQDKGFLVTGMATKYSGISKPYLLKVDSMGNMQWIKVFNQLQSTNFYNIDLTDDLGLLVYSSYQTGSLFKMNALGVITDTLRVNYGPIFNSNSSMLKMGNSYVIAQLYPFNIVNNSSNIGLKIHKINYTDFNVEWTRAFEFSNVSSYPDIKLHNESQNEFSVSFSSDFFIPLNNISLQNRGLVLKLNLNGDSLDLCEFTYLNFAGDAPMYQTMRDLIKTDEGAYIGVGQVVPANNTQAQAWVFKSGLNGVLKIADINKSTYSLRVYPNPAVNQLNFEFLSETEKVSKIELYSIDGRLLVNADVPNSLNKHSFNISKLNKGTYFYRVFFEDGYIETDKFIKIE